MSLSSTLEPIREEEGKVVLDVGGFRDTHRQKECLGIVWKKDRFYFSMAA